MRSVRLVAIGFPLDLPIALVVTTRGGENVDYLPEVRNSVGE